MNDSLMLVAVGFIFFASVSLTIISILHIYQNKKITFDKGFLIPLTACLAALLLCLSIWPPVHRVYDDELIFISQSVNLLSLGKPSIILKGSQLQPEVVASWRANLKLPGFAFLESVIFLLTKDVEHSYFILNIVLGVLSVALVYRIAWLMTESLIMACWSAIFWACLPARITYSMSAASDISGLFFFLLFFLFLNEYRSLKAKRILFAALFCGIFSICIKPFYGICVILVMTAYLYFYRKEGLLDEKRFKQALIVIFLLFLPVLCALPVMLLSDPMAGHYPISFMLNNFCTSISYLFNYKQNTPVTTIAVLAAICRSIFYKRDNLVNGLAGWLLMGLLILSMFNAGGISYPGLDYSDRHIFFIAVPFVLLAAKGITDSSTIVRSYPLSIMLLAFLFFNAFIASYHLEFLAKNKGYYKKTILLKQMATVMPDEAYVIEECAALVTAKTSKKSIQTRLFLSGDHPKEVVYLNGINDFTDPQRTKLVEGILHTEYTCKALSAAAFNESYLSAIPFLCTRKKD